MSTTPLSPPPDAHRQVIRCLSCLRQLDYHDFLTAANSVPSIAGYHSLAMSYLPRPDGKILTKSPEKLVKENRYASVPFIVGDQEDEETLFALPLSNITTIQKIVQYFKDIYFSDASEQ